MSSVILKEMVHVVMCTHNGSFYIEEQLRSITQQIYPRNIHIFDWQSTDNTFEKIKAVSSEINVYRHDFAPGPARSFLNALSSKVITELSGIIFLSDQDDIWQHDKVATVTAEFARVSQDNPVLVHHATEVFMSDNGSYEGSKVSLVQGGITGSNIAINRVIGHTVAINDVFLKKFNEKKPIASVIMHDWILGVVASQIRCNIYLPQVLTRYRSHSSNIALGRSPKNTSRVTNFIKYIRLIVNQKKNLMNSYPDLKFTLGEASTSKETFLVIGCMLYERYIDLDNRLSAR